MFKRVAMSLLVAAAPLASAVAAEVTDSAPVVDTPQAQEAVRRAKELVMQQLKAGSDAIEVKHVEAQTWPNSGMGCAKRGTVTMQVITEGYVVALVSEGHEYRVHVSGDKVFVCDKPVLMRSEPKQATNARGLDLVITQARADLVKRLNIDDTKVRVLGVEPHRWQDSTMDCPVPDQQVQPGPVTGYRIHLQHAGRIYTYHTDLTAVRACPPIEAQ